MARSKRKAKRNKFCDSSVGVGPVGNCNSNSNCNCNSSGDGHSNRDGHSNIKYKHASASEASIMLCNDLKHEFPLIHVSRRLPQRVASSIDVDIVHEVVSNILESEEKNRQMKYQDSNSALTGFDQSVGGHVPVGNDGDDDDDACLPPRSVFSYFFRFLRFANARTGGQDACRIACRGITRCWEF